MKRQRLTGRKSERGNAIMEFAIAAPLLLLMTFGAVDFGRVFYHAVTLANAAGTGAFYGSQNNIKTGHFDGMKDAAYADSQDLQGVTATSSRYCDCPAGFGGSKTTGCPTNSCVDCITGSCPGYGPPRVYVRVQTLQTFRTVVPYPGIPDPVTVGRHATMRAQ